MTAHWCTSHTINPVPCIIISDKKRIRAGGLQDIAPTILDLMYIAKPIEMTGRSLLK
jgi:2,3-bisphosphoglycerate-independent phosphoglycerate mutase